MLSQRGESISETLLLEEIDEIIEEAKAAGTTVAVKRHAEIPANTYPNSGMSLDTFAKRPNSDISNTPRDF